MTIDRATVLNLVRAAFLQAATIDYRDGHVHCEEDMRACVYRYVRNGLELFPEWRIFVNLSAFSGKGGFSKPDMSLFRWPGYHGADSSGEPQLEIAVEIKHWPNRAQVEQDVEKLMSLHDSFDEAPNGLFIAVVGTGWDRGSVAEVMEHLSTHPGVSVMLKPTYPDGPDVQESYLYRGPWREDCRLDPWRARLRNVSAPDDP